jgi:hypothetical protein
MQLCMSGLFPVSLAIIACSSRDGPVPFVIDVGFAPITLPTLLPIKSGDLPMAGPFGGS